MVCEEVGRCLAWLDEAKNEALDALRRSPGDDGVRTYWRETIKSGLYQLFSVWWRHEQEQSRECLTSGEILDRRRNVYSHSALEPYRFSNFAQATRVGRREMPDGSLLEKDVEAVPGPPSAIYTVYQRTPRARGLHSPARRGLIEMYDNAGLGFFEVDATIQRLKRTAGVICNAIAEARMRTQTASRFFVLDIGCGPNYLAREIALRLTASHAEQWSGCRVHVLGIDLDSRAKAFTFNNAEGEDGLGWHSPDTASNVDVTFMKGGLLIQRTQQRIHEWLIAHGETGFDAVVALGLIDYFGCIIPGDSRHYIRESLAPEFGRRMRQWTRRGGLVIGAVYAAEAIDPPATGGRHLVSNWHINPVQKQSLLHRFGFIEESEFLDLAAPEHVGGEVLREKLNRGVHYFVHRVE